MPRKPLHPTIYPLQTRASSIQAFAAIVSRSAVRIAQSEERQIPFEPEIKQDSVLIEASVKDPETVLRLIKSDIQLTLFEDDRP